MNVRKPILTGLLGIASLAPCKAQNPVQFFSEVGVTGVVTKNNLFYGGMNMGINAGKNYTNLYAGVTLNQKKQAGITGLVFNNYSWNKNLSSWARDVVSTSGNTLEVAPVKATLKAGKFDFSVAPAYTLYNDFESGKTTQGINFISQTVYSINNKNKIFFEGKYMTEPSNKLTNTRFGKFKDNFSYMCSYLYYF